MNTPKRLRVLWLCSWYPSKVDVFAGDFIQRHAEAASVFCDITVIHCIGNDKVNKVAKSRSVQTTGLVELIGYYPKKGALNRILSPLRWVLLKKRMVDEFIKREGLPDIVHVQVPYKSGLAARYLRWRFGIPYVVTEHWGIYNEIVSDRFSDRSFVFQLLTRIAYSKAALSLSVSAYQGDCLDKYLKPLPHLIIRNVVDATVFHPRAITSDAFTFIHVSDWSLNKNPEWIIQSFNRLFKKHPTVRLLMVGGKEENQSRLRKVPIEIGCKIEFSGEVSHKAVASLMQQADCLILFSSMENSPCVIGEALCVGLQVIATEVGGVSELIDAACGQLIPVGDEGALFTAMEHAIMNQSNYNKKEIADKACLVYAPDVIGRSILEGYRQVLIDS